MEELWPGSVVLHLASPVVHLVQSVVHPVCEGGDMQVGGRRREVTCRGCRRLGLNEGLLFLFVVSLKKGRSLCEVTPNCSRESVTPTAGHSPSQTAVSSPKTHPTPLTFDFIELTDFKNLLNIVYLLVTFVGLN